MIRKIFKNQTPPLNVVVLEFPDTDKVILNPLGDIHWDSAVCRKKLFAKKIQQIRDEKLQTLLIGDILDKLFFNSLKRDEQDSYLNEAKWAVERELEKIQDRTWVLVKGNHAKGIEKRAQFSIIEDMGNHLQIPVVKGITVLQVRVGTKRDKNKRRMQNYAGVILHGWGGGRTKGSKINKSIGLEGIWNNIDFFIMGHLHDSMSIPNKVFRFDSRNHKVRSYHSHHILLPAFQDWAEYAQEKGMPPGATMEYFITFSGEKHSMRVEQRDLEELL